MAGFQSFVINSNVANNAIQTQATTRVFGAITVTVSNSAPNGYDDRLRASPTNSGSFTEGLLLSDFVFSRDLNSTGGLDVAISGLGSNKTYRFTIWSFDSGSAGSRVSDWSANGTVVTNGYTFNGAVLPTSNEQYRFAFKATADASGQVLISARRNPASVDGAATPAPSFGVFLNALQIENDLPRITAINLAGGTVTLTVSPIDPTVAYQIDQTTNLGTAPIQWNPQANISRNTNGNTLTTQFPSSGLLHFYRVRF